MVDLRSPRLLLVRRIVGILLVTLAVIDLIAAGIGSWNPWHYVFLERYFNDPVTGVARGLALGALAAFVLTPVSSEARQNRRQLFRWGMVAVAILSLLCAGAIGRLFTKEIHVVGTDATGTRQVVVVTHQQERELRIFAGRGLTQRDAGRLGPACGSVTAQFPSVDQVRVVTSYGTFDLRLEAGSGRPLDTFGPNCAG